MSDESGLRRHCLRLIAHRQSLVAFPFGLIASSCDTAAMTAASSNRPAALTWVLIGLLALVAGMFAARLMLKSSAPVPVLASGTVLDPPRPLPEFSLLDGGNHPFRRAALNGHWTFLFFGFTNCPDVCPTTLAVLSQVSKQVADLPQLQRPAVVFMSVDPQRDTPDKVGAYAGFFGPDFIGVTGIPEEVDKFTRAVGVPVARVPLDSGGYTVDHSGAVFVIDPSASLRALFSSPRDATQLAADYRWLVTR